MSHPTSAYAGPAARTTATRLALAFLAVLLLAAAAPAAQPTASADSLIARGERALNS